jgi:class 3 adenylate cyclase/tetratricopeptide (TPR) repeat protein
VATCSSCGERNPDGARFCNACGAELAAPSSREVRKTVTVLFADVTGSTALGEQLDPESLRRVLARYFEAARGCVERHGGTVEKFIGDAVMAVFGVPTVHEDDALRALRAAAELREALTPLNDELERDYGVSLQLRTGVNTGEVVTGTDERLATGDAVNVAARLEQAAQPGEILIGEDTHELVRGAVDAEPVEALVLKGKSAPLPAFRLVSVLAGPERSHASRFVGRERELTALEQAWARAVAQNGCELVTVVGEPGVGKSRLVAEALDSIDARVARGRCLPYGEGITYWPVIEVVKQLAALPSDPAAAAALRSLLGESEQGTSADQIAWAFRKLLEEQAPLVICLDDIQWGEETFLDLVEATALLSGGAPILLLCMARPELLERRRAWPGLTRLEPLTANEANALISDEVAGDLRVRIARAAGGNPLFISEMLAMARERSDVEVPPTLRALLAARLDQLDEPERNVLERGSVEGELFHRGAVQALAPEEAQVTARLTALVRRDLVRPDRAQLVGDDAFRFRHLLIRDAAYEALPKSVRAELHERFAGWLDQRGGVAELDEIVGYHLEQAVAYRRELGQPANDIAVRAGERLAAAGRRALWREDRRAASVLLERALELTRPLQLDIVLEADLAETSLVDDSRGAALLLERAAERAAAEGDASGEAFARAMAAYHRYNMGGGRVAELEALALAALPLLEQAGDHAALVHVWNALGVDVANNRGRWADHARASEQALEHSRLAGQQRSGLFFIQLALVNGATPADEALERLDRLLPESPDAYSLINRAWLLAMLDRFDEAVPLARESNARLRDLDGRRFGESRLAEIAIYTGDHEAAAGHLRELCEWLEEQGLLGYLCSFAPDLGRELCRLGRYEEAEPLARRGRELAEEGDVTAQASWRQTQALVHLHRGEYAEGERLAREAVAVMEQTDGLNFHGRALCVLAEVLLAAGRDEEAVVALTDALERYERKRNLPMARQVREELAGLQAGTQPV